MADTMTYDSGVVLSKCFKTTDGEVFDDYDEATEHQLRVNVCERLERHWVDSMVNSCDAAIATDAIMKNLKGLVSIFQIYLEEKG